MRVLLISSADNFGGGEKHLVDLAEGLSCSGNAVSVVVRPGCGWTDRISGVKPSNIHSLPLRGSADVFSAMRLATLVRETGADILHAHMARDYVPAALAARKAGLTGLVLTRHVLFPMSRINRLLLRNVSRIIAVSSAVESNLKRTFPEEKIVAVPNGIAMERFTGIGREKAEAFRTSYGIPPAAKLVTSVGELKPLKGQEDFILAASEIAKGDPEAHFLLIGKDNSAGSVFRKKLRRMARVLDLDDRVTFLDWVEDTGPMLAATDVFVSTSHTESFGLAILEALAAGRPVVATSTAGASELIEEGVSGLLAGIKEPLEVANAVRKVINDELLAERLGRAAQVRAVENFSLEKMIARTLSVYEDILTQAA